MTVTEAATLARGARLDADVVVVGSGPAGLTVALDLAGRGIDVLVVESGGRGVSPEARDLDRGEVVGEPLRFAEAPYDTSSMRLRVLGGASGHWAGMCRPLDDLDLRARPWIPGSGWPIDRADLEPWYRRAEATLDLGTTGWDPEAWYERCGTSALLPGDRLTTTIFQFSPPTRFATDFERALEAPTGPRVVVGATAVDVALDASGRRIDELTLRRADGGTLTARATTIVLAAGGLEVPRLLLAWDGGRGVATSSGLVGLGYMDHPHRTAGQVRATLGSELPPLYAWGDAPGDGAPAKVWAGWSPTPELQEAEGLGQAVALLRFTDALTGATAEPTAVTDAMGRLVSWTIDPAVHRAVVTVRAEHWPGPGSRVTLGTDRDASGLPRLRLAWRPGPEEERTMRRTVELLAEELGRAGLGRVEVDPRGRPLAEGPLEIGCHPMGATRMGDDPSASVVDPDLRAHDVENLYVCGSAVFPTSGHANPTLTVVALAHRLADHLAGDAG